MNVDFNADSNTVVWDVFEAIGEKSAQRVFLLNDYAACFLGKQMTEGFFV